MSSAAGDCRRFGHQQLERQGGQRARRHDQQIVLALEQRLDRAQQVLVGLMREREIEQVVLVGRASRPRSTFSPRRNAATFLRQGLGSERQAVPVDAFAGQREQVGIGFARDPDDHRLVGAEQGLDFLGTERLRAGERRVIREFLFQPRIDGSELAPGIGDVVANLRDGFAILLRLRPRHDRDQPLSRSRARAARSWLSRTSCGQRVGAGGEARAHLLQRLRRRRMVGPLRHLEGFAGECGLRFEIGFRGIGEPRDPVGEHGGALPHETSLSASLVAGDGRCGQQRVDRLCATSRAPPWYCRARLPAATC